MRSWLRPSVAVVLVAGLCACGGSDEAGGIAADTPDGTTDSLPADADGGPDGLDGATDGETGPPDTAVDTEIDTALDGGEDAQNDGDGHVSEDTLVDGDGGTDGDGVDDGGSDDGDAGDQDVSDGDGPLDVPTVDGDMAEDVEPGCTEDADCEASGPCWLAACDVETGVCSEDTMEEGTACDDGNACSLGDKCMDTGYCVGIFAINCDDQNPCTDDLCFPATGCQFKHNFAACDDEDPCTTGDICVAGSCKSGDPVCDDQNPCTIDYCDGVTGACGYVADDELWCTDGSDCTLGDGCVAGVCVPGAVDGCDDDNDCTEDVCEGNGTCSQTILDGTACEDGNACTQGDTCNDGACVTGPPQSCDDGNPCTGAVCDPEVGCVSSILSGDACDDQDACTLVSFCTAEGVCDPTVDLTCEDGNTCTADSCDPATGCVFTPEPNPCDDGDACTGDDSCVGSACWGSPISCNDQSACTIDSCDPLIGCQFIDTSSACDDGNLCTDDGCNPSFGCEYTANVASCEDGDACTGPDVCKQGACDSQPIDCDDADPCTVDVCDYEEGCLNEPFIGPCDDGDPCTTDEFCDAAGVCGEGVPTDLDDGVPCTVDSCDPATGFAHAPDDSLCGVAEICNEVLGCVYGDVRVMITKVLLSPDVVPTVDGQGQWIAVTNVGDLAVDLRDLILGTLDGGSATILAPSGDPADPVLLGPGETRAGQKAPEPGTVVDPSLTSFVYGSFGDGFGFDESGDVLSLTLGGAVIEVLDMGSVTLGPDVPAGVFPVVVGAPTELDAASVATADGTEDNDIADSWCVWPAGSAGPEGAHLSCGRARLNEIALAGLDGQRWVEVHLPAGGHTDGLVVRVADGDGVILSTQEIPDGRMPIGQATVILDGEGAISLPALTDGGVQLVRSGLLTDSYGFGTLQVQVDASFGFALVEGTAGPAQQEGDAAERIADGVDTDDNAADWHEVVGGSPGELNAP